MKKKETGGTHIAWLGAIIYWGDNTIFMGTDYYWLIWGIAMAITMVGCVLWALRKNRHWAFAFWGLIAPIGFLGISLLRDKTPKVETLETVQESK